MASLLRPYPISLIRACTTTTTTTIQSPPQSLEERFGRKGIKFTESSGIPTVELSVRNGSSLQLRIPDALVTSYKPKVYWKDDGFEEVLYTIPGTSPGSVKGGLSLLLNDVSQLGPGGAPQWQPSEWVVKDVDNDSFDAVQVELSCNKKDGSLELIYVVSLYPTSITAAVIVKNKGKKPVKLTSAILSHIKFKSKSGSAIEGLRKCSYSVHPPLNSNYGILSPADAVKHEEPGWFSTGSSNGSVVKDSWNVEEDLYTVLRGKMSRVYTAPPGERTKRIYNTPPSRYITIDQGSGLGFRIIRMGFDDIYLCSPGSFYKQYGKEYFIYTGPASMLVPVELNPGEDWKAAKVIEHDNL